MVIPVSEIKPLLVECEEAFLIEKEVYKLLKYKNIIDSIL
jgi:hypothetical protein